MHPAHYNGHQLEQRSSGDALQYMEFLQAGRMAAGVKSKVEVVVSYGTSKDRFLWLLLKARYI